MLDKTNWKKKESRMFPPPDRSVEVWRRCLLFPSQNDHQLFLENGRQVKEKVKYLLILCPERHWPTTPTLWLPIIHLEMHRVVEKGVDGAVVRPVSKRPFSDSAVNDGVKRTDTETEQDPTKRTKS